MIHPHSCIQNTMTIFDNDGFEESELEHNFSTVIYVRWHYGWQHLTILSPKKTRLTHFVHMLKGQQDHYISGVCLFKYVSWSLDDCLRWCPYLRVRRDHEPVREWPVPRFSVCWYVCALCIQLLGVPTTIPALRWGLFRLRNLDGETLSCTRATHLCPLLYQQLILRGK